MGHASIARVEGAPVRSLSPASREIVGTTATFALCWVFLNAVLNVRYPAAEPRFWYFLPSIDVTALFCLYGLAGALRVRIPAIAQAAVTGCILLLRCLRFGDGIEEQFFRTFNLYIDGPLVPELARLFYVTVPHGRLAFEAALGLLVGIVLAMATYKAIRYAEGYLAEGRHRAVLAGIVALLVVGSLSAPIMQHPEHYAGIFGASIVPRVVEEVEFLLHARGYRAEKTKNIIAEAEWIRRLPAGLSKLHGAPVLLFVVESYGQAVFSRPDYAARMRPAYEDFEARLRARGFSMVSALLDSSTYGGRSWLAHATLATGVRVADQLEYDLLQAQNPATMAGFFRAAGYDTVLVQPGSTRKVPEPAAYGFERTYAAWDFDYGGPSFSWVPMPDQYVLDFIHRREIAPRVRPLFVEYVLVTSHAPWSVQPAVVDDWAKLARGDIYHRLPPVRFPITWTDLSRGGEAYLTSIGYDLSVLESYFESFLPDDALAILIGDHQPVAEVARQSSYGVPVHVVSKNPAFAAAFEERGYVRGMRPRCDGPIPGMQTFLPTLLEALSGPSSPAFGK